MRENTLKKQKKDLFASKNALKKFHPAAFKSEVQLALDLF